MADRLIWELEGRDWPNRAASRFVEASGFRWHVQIMGKGPKVVLLHGTGAASHSWRAVLPSLATRYTVIALDLPGHGFTDMPATGDLSLPGMASDVTQLLRALECVPDFVAGHSAGAAIMLQMHLDNFPDLRGMVSVNGALQSFSGIAGHIFSPLAKFLARSSIFPALFSLRATNPSVVRRLIRDTGSVLDAQGIENYQCLVQSRSHVAAALKMMANWDLHPLQARFSEVKAPLVLVAGKNDRTVSPVTSIIAQRQIKSSRLMSLPGLGHLAHEEQPETILKILDDFVIPQRC